VGILLERARWIADLTAALPDSTPLPMSPKSLRSPLKTSGFTALRDESKQIVYRWGDDGAPADPPLASRPLSSPLTSWQLEYHSDDPLTGSASAALIVSLAGIGVVLLGLGAYVLTGVQRQMRTARQRVSFASQVSHELRTPLTNIRLYAELAESDLARLPESEPRSSIQKRLEVIDTESRRLGRLVSGVLEMIRDHRKPQGPRIVPVVPDEVIEQALMQFAPSFHNADLKVERQWGAGRVVGLDPDILEMILVNLLSNVEKYASGGKQVTLSSRMDGNDLVVRVADRGPGISWRHRRTVFRPFSRLDDSINAPSGTGIGLTIAQRLARRHGGLLELVDSDRGACFELRLPTRDISESTWDGSHQGES
jgi:signal transduction histidine kinase